MKKYYVNVYEVYRAYGGPEEGGWWYDAGEPVFTKVFTDEQEARSFSNEVYENMPEHSGEYRMGYSDIDGCDPDGNGDDAFLTPGGQWGKGDYRVYFEYEPAKPFPETRPYYE